MLQNGLVTRNNSKYPYYKKSKKCESCWNDCTKFVSQAIKAGGMKYRKGGIFTTYRSDKV